MAKQKKRICNGSNSFHSQPNSSTFDQSTQEVLSGVFAKEQQTYEEFLTSFIYLKNDDFLIDNKVATSSNTPATSSNTPATSSNDDINSKAIIVMESQQTSVANHSNSQDGVDELIQENLSPRSVAASFLLRNHDSTHPKIQLDNFVGDESLEIDSNSCGGYHPTICEESNQDSVIEIISSTQNNIGSSSCGYQRNLASDKDICLPGEVEPDCTPAAIPVHMRCLNIRTQKSNLRERTNEKGFECSSAVGQETEVEAFYLDKDFDYDNLQVTPKFDFLFV